MLVRCIYTVGSQENAFEHGSADCLAFFCTVPIMQVLAMSLVARSSDFDDLWMFDGEDRSDLKISSVPCTYPNNIEG